MTETEVAKELAQLMGDILYCEVSHTALDANLGSEYGATSMDTVDIVARVERKFQIQIRNDRVGKLTTFGDVLQLILSRART
jgi:acyl carrier protein